MSWNKIKTFLIILFLIINAYLIYSDGGFHSVFSGSYTSNDVEIIAKTADIIKNNYGIDVDTDSVPKRIGNLNNLDVTNLIYTDKLNSSPYVIKHNYKDFTVSVITETYSYNEQNATVELKKILSDLGLDDKDYKLFFIKNDLGLNCYICGCIDKYFIFNNRIEAVFSSQKITLKGSWYISESDDVPLTASKMKSVTTFLMDAANRMSNQKNDQKQIKNVDFGYFVSYYDEEAVNKSATAIPCYVIETDIGSKYYYDSFNGNFLKMEE